MNDSLPPSLPAQPSARPRGLGCFAKGCLTTVTLVMLVGVGIGALGWYFVKSGQAYFTERQVPTRIAEATDDQYQAVLGKLQPFGQAMREGHAATVELTTDDLNTLIARLPQLAPLRGQTFVNIAHGQLLADLSFPATEGNGAGQYFINARTTLDASFASGKFTFALRQAAPLQGEAKDGLLPSLLRNPTFLQSYSQMISHDFNLRLRDLARRDPMVAEMLAKLQTVVIKDDKIVASSAERPDLSPPVSPVATPAKPE